MTQFADSTSACFDPVGPALVNGSWYGVLLGVSRPHLLKFADGIASVFVDDLGICLQDARS
jgi:hypothetical protein